MASLLKRFGADWRDKAERSLLLAKQLGNIYTGSLYNGLLSLLCDQTIDLSGKKICMFSYGSGCAASMFILSVRPGYEKIRQLSCFKERLARRVKVSPEDYNGWMSLREQSFGKSNLIPTVSLSPLPPHLCLFAPGFDRKLRRRHLLLDQNRREVHSTLRDKGRWVGPSRESLSDTASQQPSCTASTVTRLLIRERQASQSHLCRPLGISGPLDGNRNISKARS